MKKLSPLQTERLKYQPKLPSSLANGINLLDITEGEATQSVRDQEQIKSLFTKRHTFCPLQLETQDKIERDYYKRNIESYFLGSFFFLMSLSIFLMAFS